MVFRTDLAVEARELLEKDIGGTDYFTQRYGDVTLTRLKIKTPEAAGKMGKPEGTYLTFDVPPFSDDFRDPAARIELIGKELASLLPQRGLILVAGLGNTEITPDNLGPKTAKGVLATRHITGELARSTGLDDLRPVAVLAPGVLGQTGIETGELLYSVTQKLRPAALIVVDALASRRLDRLGCTVQVSDTGISPGSGVGNARPKIDRQTMGVPVVSIGVPTVVDALTLVHCHSVCQLQLPQHVEVILRLPVVKDHGKELSIQVNFCNDANISVENPSSHLGSIGLLP